uniref:Uncharacterized protein n=1 Tax=Meloidogyne hapla TaxID=6305 RepID=A0A1I8BFC3_MELHA
MPNANLVPLENVRKWPRGIDSNSTQQSTSNITTAFSNEQNVLKEENQTNNSQYTSGACTKCGNFGHLTFQFHTFTQKKSKKNNNVLSSNSSSKEEINSLLKMNEKAHNSPSTGDSCISLESQKESFHERIQRLEIEKDKMSKAFELILGKFEKQNSTQHLSPNSSLKEFVTFNDLQNHPFIQQLHEKIKSLTQKMSDRQIMIEQNLSFQKLTNNENKINNFGFKQQKEDNNQKELEIKKIKRKEEINLNTNELKEENQKLKNELVTSKNLVSLLELERTQIKQQFEKDIEKIQNEFNHYKSENERFSDLYNKQKIKDKAINEQNINLARKNRKLSAELDLSNKKIKELETQINQINNNANKQEDEKVNEEDDKEINIKVDVQNEKEKQMRFVKIKNKINRIDCEYTCCENKCINSNISNGCCNSKNGYVCVYDVNNCFTKIKYYFTNNKRKENKWIRLFAQISFSKGCCYGKGFSLYYFEVTMIKEETNFCYAGIGLYNTTVDDTNISNTNTNIFLCNDSTINWQDYQKFSWEDGDVFGYGIVYPARSDYKTDPYIFLLKMGVKLV